DHVGAGLKAVHFNEQLVQSLFALVVSATQAGAAVATHGVDLVYENDRGRIFLRLREQITYARGTDTNEHFHEVGTRNRVERNLRLTGHRAGQQRLTGSGRAVEQNALGNLRAHGLE